LIERQNSSSISPDFSASDGLPAERGLALHDEGGFGLRHRRLPFRGALERVREFARGRKALVGILGQCFATTRSNSGDRATLIDDGIGGSSWMIFFATVQAPSPVNGFWPVRTGTG